MIRFIRSLLLFALLIGFGASAVAVYVKERLGAPGPLAVETPFTVERGMSVSDVVSDWEQRGIIEDGWILAFYAWASGDARRIRAGDYLAPQAASMASLLDMVVAGREHLQRITIPEGWTSEMAMARINETAGLASSIEYAPPEGSLLPDTYAIRKGEDRNRIISVMQQAQQDLMAELWPQRAKDLPFDTPEQAIILASIVERETAIAEERPRVAAVFINRLRKNMRLQSDPTVIYGIVGGKGRLDRNLTRADLQKENPYNTYKIDGLPPGPIANPGKDAIASVLNPLNTKDLYFVADGTGGHAFAETLGDHNDNVKEWRELRRRLAEQAAAAAAARKAQPPIPRPRPPRS